MMATVYPVKCVVIGDPCAGKSKAIMKFVYGKIFDDIDPTIANPCRKIVAVLGAIRVMLDILDTAGHSDNAAMRKQHYRTADVVIIMYSVTNLQSFENVRQYHDRVCMVRDPITVPYILAGMKYRQGDTTQVPYVEGRKMAQDIKAEFFECSALTGDGLDELFWKAAAVGSTELYGVHFNLYRMNDFSVEIFNEILRQGMEENHDIQVMLVGQAAVGKTTLTRRLLTLPVTLKEYNSTNGVDVHINSCDIEIDSGKWVIKKQDKSLRKKLMELLTKRIKRHEENANTSKITGHRDFHLRCAKLIGKVPEVKSYLPKWASSSNESLSDFNNRVIGNPTGVEDDGTDTEKHDKTESKQSRLFLKPKQMKRTTQTLDSFNMSDLELTLQQAKSLPSESSTRLAKVSLYDFAGQYIFHASHPTFLSPQAIYILVFNLNKLIEWKGKTKKMDQYSHEDEEQYYGDCRGHGALGDQESIFFWLNVIYLFAALKQNIKPQVILVGTHYDKLPKAERDALIEKFFRDLHCKIAATPLKELVSNEYVVDNSKKDDSSFSNIRSEIFRLAKLQPNWGRETPTKWLPLEREMQGLKESGLKVLSMEELIEINSGLDLRVSDEIEMELLLQFLHNTGEIIFFSEKSLRNFIVLDPVWLIDALKLIITSDRFALRIPKLAEKWINFYKTGVIYRSTIVGIFEERTEDPALYENHEHVLLLMEKFLFIAAPVQFPDEVAESACVYEEVDTCYIMPCMVHKEIDTTLITSPEGTSGTSVLCLVSINHFLPPAVFQKLLAICIKKWPIVEQHGQKLIFCGVCKFNLDESKNYKLTVFQVGYAVHARVVSYCREEHLPQAVCGSVYEFLVQSLRSVLRGMGFADMFRICIQCPEISASALENSGYIDMNVAEGLDGVTCDDCHVPHSIQSQKLLEGWIKRSSENSHDNYSDDVAGCVPADVVSLETASIDDQCLGAIGGTDPGGIDDSTDGDDGAVSFIDNASEDDDSAEDQEYNGDIDIGPFTQEHMNYARLCNVIVTLGADALRDVLVTQVPVQYTDIYRALLGNIAAIRGMRQIGREQFQLIFQDPQFRYTGTADQFDITLLYTLIRNISSCPAPATGWGKPPDDLPRDVSLGASVERIRLMRNKVSGHSADGKLADQAYEDHMDEIKQILDNIEVVLGDHGYKDAFEKRRKQILTTQEAQALRKKFENYQQHLKVGIFEERTEDPALYENHEHVLLLMEKFLFIAAPVQFPDEVAESACAYEEVDTCYIMPCMVHKEIDTTLITSLEGTSGTSVLCLVSINHFLPPAVFQKLLAICIKKWPIVEQQGQKLIFCGVCKFNLDESRNYKLTVFQVGYAVHARVVSYCREEHLPQAVCGSVYEFLVQSLRCVLRGMGFADMFRICIQCPEISALENSGYIDMNVAEGLDGVTCDDCHVPHSIQSQKLLEGWIKRSSENSHDNHSDDVARCVPADVVSLESAGIDDQCLGAVGGTDPGGIDDSTDGDGDDGAVSFIDNASEDDDSAEDQEYKGDKDIGPFTQEHMNYARLCNVIVTLGADALRDVLVTQVPVQYTDIYRALLGNIAAIRGMRQIGREQFQLIFQDPQFRYTGTVDQFDITLLYTLIRNISSCPAPATGWGKPPDDLPRDVTFGACVERIRLMRNKVSGHSADGKLVDQAYEDHMDEIKQILDDIEVVLGDHGYKDAFEKRRKQIITTQEAQALRKKFENYQQHLKDSRDAMVEAYESFKEIMDIMDAKVEQLSTAIDQNI